MQALCSCGVLRCCVPGAPRSGWLGHWFFATRCGTIAATDACVGLAGLPPLGDGSVAAPLCFHLLHVIPPCSAPPLPPHVALPCAALPPPPGARLQEATGYHLEVATVRRLEFENDTFAFGDKLIKKWYKGEAAVRVGVMRGACLLGSWGATMPWCWEA